MRAAPYRGVFALIVVTVLASGPVLAGGIDPWADRVVSFSSGIGPVPGYDNPAATLGSPERVTGRAFGFPSSVTPFNPPFQNDEIVSIGAGGHLTVEFFEPITNSASNLFGVDLLIFGNGFFTGSPISGIFEEGPFTVSVSSNGSDFVTLPGLYFDGMFPTLGFLDSTDPFGSDGGLVPSDFTRPVNPALSLVDFTGLSFAQLIALYDGSGGGIPVDIGPSGLSEVYFVRLDVLDGKIEIDAFSTVPEPHSLLLVAGLALALRRGALSRGR